MRFAAIAASAALLATSGAARAGFFDGQGEYHADPEAIFFAGFDEDVERWVPDVIDHKCGVVMSSILASPDALDGQRFLRLNVVGGCAERLLVDLPAEPGSYKITLWTRHGALNAQLATNYADGSGLETDVATLAPTGRTTSDGWIELASNAVSIDGAFATRTYLRLIDFAGPESGIDVDAIEIVRAGAFVPQATCKGIGDPVCGDEEVCVFNRCRQGARYVPPLPDPAIKTEMVDFLEGRLRVFFGGKKTRAEDLPKALAVMEEMRDAETAWQFWSAWSHGIRRLHDWHTAPGGAIQGVGGSRRLNVCFFEGDADASQLAWPKDPSYPDILVSHAGTEANAGLHAGDRLIAVDGRHPIAWARDLIETSWGFHSACDDQVFAEFAEDLGGPTWAGGALILKYATSFTVLRCDAAAGTCADVPETIEVTSLQEGGGGWDVACDNRPFYHFVSGNPNPDNHYVFWDFFSGPIKEADPDEKIYGMVWDTLYGGGDPNGWVNSHISGAITDWKANARGVILDHRAGNGGTLDAAENVTKLVRPVEDIAVIRMPMEIAGFDGPADLAEGVAIFEKFKASSGYRVGSASFDPDLPVAMILHRDGSASDYLPYGMKGAPKVRLFGPHATAGAFSTFINYNYYGGISFQIASGDTIGKDGQALIGHGVEPDVVVLPRQSDLLAGKDTLHEAALAWVRQELKP